MMGSILRQTSHPTPGPRGHANKAAACYITMHLQVDHMREVNHAHEADQRQQLASARLNLLQMRCSTRQEGYTHRRKNRHALLHLPAQRYDDASTAILALLASPCSYAHTRLALRMHILKQQTSFYRKPLRLSIVYIPCLGIVQG